MSLMSFEAAKAALLERARSVAERESVDLAVAFGRVLAEPLVSTLTVPPFANAAMDGYALRAADVPAAGTRLPVRGRAAAGDPPGILPPGAAVRIFTGAALPEGADTVVMQEFCEAADNDVVINLPPPRGQYVRHAGARLSSPPERGFRLPPSVWPPRSASTGSRRIAGCASPSSLPAPNCAGPARRWRRGRSTIPTAT